MRVLTIEPGPHFSVADVHVGYVEAFANLGAQVRNLNFGNRLQFFHLAQIENDDGSLVRIDSKQADAMAREAILSEAYKTWPDIVFATSGFFLTKDLMELLRSRGHKLVVRHTESPYEDEKQAELAKYADLNVLNDPQNLDEFPRAIYEPHCFRPAIHCPGPPLPSKKSEFAFVGTGYPSRVQFFESVDFTGIDALFGGNWWLEDDSPLRQYVEGKDGECVDNSETVEIYRSTEASVNIYRQESMRQEDDTAWSMGPREVELAATGTFFLTEPRPENEKVLPMVPKFEGPEEFESKLRFFLKKPELRNEIAHKARLAVSDRTFDASLQRILKELKNG